MRKNCEAGTLFLSFFYSEKMELGNYFRVKIPDLEDRSGTSKQTSPPSVQNKYQFEKKVEHYLLAANISCSTNCSTLPWLIKISEVVFKTKRTRGQVSYSQASITKVCLNS